jgi:hypothetical protein
MDQTIENLKDNQKVKKLCDVNYTENLELCKSKNVLRPIYTFETNPDNSILIDLVFIRSLSLDLRKILVRNIEPRNMITITHNSELQLEYLIGKYMDTFKLVVKSSKKLHD